MHVFIYVFTYLLIYLSIKKSTTLIVNKFIYGNKGSLIFRTCTDADTWTDSIFFAITSSTSIGCGTIFIQIYFLQEHLFLKSIDPLNTIIFWNLIVKISPTKKMCMPLHLLRYQVWLSNWGTDCKYCLDTFWILILFLLKSLSSWESSTPPQHLLFLLLSNIHNCTVICISQISSIFLFSNNLFNSY